MIAGVGVDIVKVGRIARVCRRHGDRFARKILSPEELAGYERSGDKVGMLARRFAAKEAVAKALGTGMRGGVHFPQIVIVSKPSGAPRVVLDGPAASRADVLDVARIHLSISDEEEYAVAFAVLEARGDSPG